MLIPLAYLAAGIVIGVLCTVAARWFGRVDAYDPRGAE